VPKTGDLLQVLRLDIGLVSLPLDMDRTRRSCCWRTLRWEVTVKENHTVGKQRSFTGNADTTNCRRETVTLEIRGESAKIKVEALMFMNPERRSGLVENTLREHRTHASPAYLPAHVALSASLLACDARSHGKPYRIK
jgi:hypothetical protein